MHKESKTSAPQFFKFQIDFDVRSASIICLLKLMLNLFLHDNRLKERTLLN